MKSALLLFSLIASTFIWAQEFNGYALYNKSNQNTTYLIDKDGGTAHTWSCTDPCNYTVLMKDDGNIVRGAKYSDNELSGAAIGGLVQEYDPSGDVVWEFVYSTDEHCSHHDIAINPVNNSVFLTAWEVKSAAELTAAGYADAGGSDKWPTHIVEVQPDGSGGGEIIWEWHLWDHMVQDEDASKDNFGVVEDHPELMDINAVSSGGGGGPGGGDWFHVNGIDYNAQLDQIVFSSRHASEIYIIDHSTTTVEAASHAGGNSGKGGDFLYRWGNPDNYGAPGVADIPAACHDARWVKEGRPNAGNIQFFNNEGGTGGHSAVDMIVPPLSVDGYNYDYTLGEAYGPAAVDTRHECEEDSDGQSASDRMSNGNIFVAVSGEYMYEATAAGDVIWSYAEGPQKAFRYECDHEGVLVVVGDLCGVGIDEHEATHAITVYPNPSNGMVTIDGLVDLNNYSVEVIDLQGRIVYATSNENQLVLDGLDNGIYTVRIFTDQGIYAVEQITINK